jgi:hypothetical protein
MKKCGFRSTPPVTTIASPKPACAWRDDRRVMAKPDLPDMQIGDAVTATLDSLADCARETSTGMLSIIQKKTLQPAAKPARPFAVLFLLRS